MSARSKKFIGMRAGGRSSKPISLCNITFYPIKVSVYAEMTDGECSGCDFKIDIHTLIITTFNEVKSIQNYHLSCYTKSTNHIHFNWPDCSARIHNLNTLTPDQQLMVKQILLPKISMYQFQLIQEISQHTLDKIPSSLDDQLQQALEKRDIGIYYQSSKYDEPRWDLDHAIHKYKHYFKSQQYQNKKEHVIKWYFRSTSINNYFPNYLMKIIMRYCAEF